MGLDMYLTKSIFVGAEYEHMKVTGKIEIFQDGKPLKVNLNKVSSIEEQTGYWRKANAIHKWFVDNVQNGVDECQTSYVSSDKLLELLDLVNKVLSDHSLAEQLLPTSSGFFFGNYDYDEWYLNNLENTKQILEFALSEPGEYYYRASW